MTLHPGRRGPGAVGLFSAPIPHLLPDGQTVLADSDKLFPQFIVIGLPVGLSGLVVAGLLACAMSALSAGINSTCSVITVDIIDRLRGKNKTAESGRVGQLKYVSVLVGVIVVCLSLFVNMVQGNLLEICYKVVNLLTAPLAGLFFLAMFVPWARGFGALVGAACGLTVVIAVSYWKEITGTPGISFLWAMPLSLLAEVGVGALVSLIPIGRRGTIKRRGRGRNVETSGKRESSDFGNRTICLSLPLSPPRSLDPYPCPTQKTQSCGATHRPVGGPRRDCRCCP